MGEYFIALSVVVHVSLAVAVAVAVDFADSYIVGCERVEFGQEGHERVADALSICANGLCIIFLKASTYSVMITMCLL